MKRTALLVAALMVVNLGACEDQPELGPVINRDGLISGVKTNVVGTPYKEVILSGVAICDADDLVEIFGTLTQGTVVTDVEGGFRCKAGQTIKWVNTFGNGAFPPDPRLKPGIVDVNLRFDTDETGDRVYIRRNVTLHDK